MPTFFTCEVNGCLAALTLTGGFLIFRAYTMMKSLEAVDHLPGIRPLFPPFSLAGRLLPATWWNPTPNITWNRRYDLYKSFNAEIVSCIPFLHGGPSLYTCNKDIIQQVLVGEKSSWIKYTQPGALSLFGTNIVSTDGDTWKRHRRIVGPAFNTKTDKLVWDNVVTWYRKLTGDWAEKPVVEVPVVQRLMFDLSLFVIASCGFGLQSAWPPIEGMSLQTAMRTVSQNGSIWDTLPKWIFWLPLTRLRNIRIAVNVLQEYMTSQVAARREEVRFQQRDPDDFFTMLVQANEQGGQKYSLSDQELIGNVYVLLLAGHETTANALASAICCLSLYPDIQNEVHEQIQSVIGYRDPTYEDFGRLDKVLAVFNETVRFLSSASLTVREAAEDTVLVVPDPSGQSGHTSLRVAKGTAVVVDFLGMHRRSKYFADPEEFRPSRWYESVNEPEGYMPFGSGPRACVGRKFAISEAVCFLTLLLRDWRLEPILRSRETQEMWKERVIQGRLYMTMGVSDAPIRFVRRE